MTVLSLIVVFRRFVICVLVFWFVNGASAWAGDLTVKVSRQGQPVVDALVCVGTHQERGLFGTQKTMADGIANFSNLPNGSVIITAAKEGFSGQVVRPNQIVAWVFVDLSATVKGLSCPVVK